MDPKLNIVSLETYGFLFNILTHLLHGVMKLVGLTPQTLEIDHDTLMDIWLPKEAIVKQLDGKGKPLYAPPKKPVVLLLHCFAMDGIFLWFPQVLALTTEYSVYVPDLLFFGGSTTRKTERSARFQAEVLAKTMEMLGVQKVAVVGLSYGGIDGCFGDG
ncbi:hypothetical protein OSB04_016216 [Centaurea solstitialis]|uniref:AB hydrolase-1 domain-containing protein n=1 Tax=Centaurea solstitialis TaxID=347529 RepID=A0AA38WKU8_9ASTR|nr:hypothetical protein OSB04_016216 [Centaurea solstitialis]